MKWANNYTASIIEGLKDDLHGVTLEAKDIVAMQ
jgi:hypothetical protein